MALFSNAEMSRINQLVAAALLDTTVRERLLSIDDSLAREFAIAPTSWMKLKGLPTHSVEEFYQHVLDMQEELLR